MFFQLDSYIFIVPLLGMICDAYRIFKDASIIRNPAKIEGTVLDIKNLTIWRKKYPRHQITVIYHLNNKEYRRNFRDFPSSLVYGTSTPFYEIGGNAAVICQRSNPDNAQLSTCRLMAEGKTGFIVNAALTFLLFIIFNV